MTNPFAELLEQEIASTETKLAALNVLRELLNGGGHGCKAKPKAKKPGASAGDGDGKAPRAVQSSGPLSRRLGEFLRENGPRRSDAIKRALGVSEADLCQLVGLKGDQHKWFAKEAGLLTLSSGGNLEFFK